SMGFKGIWRPLPVRMRRSCSECKLLGQVGWEPVMLPSRVHGGGLQVRKDWKIVEVEGYFGWEPQREPLTIMKTGTMVSPSTRDMRTTHISMLQAPRLRDLGMTYPMPAAVVRTSPWHIWFTTEEWRETRRTRLLRR